MNTKNDVIEEYENTDFFISEFNRLLREKQAAIIQNTPETCSENSELT
jgi:hypothetical protein